MVVTLILGIGLHLGLGLLSTTDAFFGVEWVEEAHEVLAYGLLGLVGPHIAGVVPASSRLRENAEEAQLMLNPHES